MQDASQIFRALAALTVFNFKEFVSDFSRTVNYVDDLNYYLPLCLPIFIILCEFYALLLPFFLFTETKT